jgi:hypothetical protein
MTDMRRTELDPAIFDGAAAEAASEPMDGIHRRAAPTTRPDALVVRERSNAALETTDSAGGCVPPPVRL